jgi:hypothetical protein
VGDWNILGYWYGIKKWQIKLLRKQHQEVATSAIKKSSR